MYKKRRSKKGFFIITFIILCIVIINLYNVYNSIDINTYEDESKKNVIRLSRNDRARKRKQ